MITLKEKIIAILFISVISCTSLAGRVIYVDDDAAGANDGSSWQNAYTFLQDALADANSSEKPVEIRVSQGTYKPDQGEGQTAGDRNATFQLINNVTLSGGYAGAIDPDPNQFDIRKYETVLSGDLGGNDIEVDDPNIMFKDPARAENSYHVVISSDVDSTTTIDGFTITGGYAEPYFPYAPLAYQPIGAGMYNSNGNPKVLNCTFKSNLAGNGGGIYNSNGNPCFCNCTFYSNMARNLIECYYDMCFIYYGLGGAVFNSGSSPEFIDCRFIGNSAYFGGGTYNQSNFPVYTNCIFEENNAQGRGDGMYNQGEGGGMSNNGSNPILNNCIFRDNKAALGAGIGNRSSTVKLNECTFTLNIAHRTGGGIINYNSNSLLVGCKFIGNQVSSGGGMDNSQSNVDMYSCLFSGNLAKNSGGGIYNDFESNLSLTNCTFFGNRGKKGNSLACISYLTESPSVINMKNCIVWDGLNEIYKDDDSIITITYSNIRGLKEGEGNIDVDPLYANPGYWADANDPNIVVEPNNTNAVWIDGDYHLKSQAGRFDPITQSWVQDDVTSPCIDAGDPNSPIGYEPFPNGGYINMGAYGGTAEASKSYFGKTVCTTIVAGDINGDCKVDILDLEILMQHWLEEH